MGERFGMLTVIEEIRGVKSWDVRCRCLCDCGKETIVYRSNLRSGKTKSCGCMSHAWIAQANTKRNEYVIDKKRGVAIGKATNTGNEFIIDLEDYERVSSISWYEANTGYMNHKDRDSQVISMHRFIMQPSESAVIDHINHNRKDNRKSNLRICTQKENSKNRKRLPNGIVEVSRGKRTYYLVQLKGRRENGKGYRGCFKSYEDAKELRDKIISEEYS